MNPTQRYFLKQIHKNLVSHAYLLIGNEANAQALWMAQTLLCSSKDGACGTCQSCVRIVKNDHADFMNIGENERLKKSNIVSLKSYFSKSSIEGNKQVYMINNVDEATPEALNSLLKFLEEPEGDVTALLTAKNENMVLETIKSRCQILNTQENARERSIAQLLAAGFDHTEASLVTACHVSEDKYVTLQEDVRFRGLMTFTLDISRAMNQGALLEAMMILGHDMIKTFKIERTEFEYVLLMLIDIYSFSKDDIVYRSVALDSLEISRRKTYLELIVKVRDRLRPGVNVNLAIDQMVIELDEIRKQYNLN